MDKQDKPLRDWTLGETMEYCKQHGDRASCSADCLIIKLCKNHPWRWDLKDPPRFTDDELATMRVLYAAGVVRVCKFDDGWIRWDGKDFGGSLPPGMFPSIRPGQSVSIADIIKNKEEK